MIEWLIPSISTFSWQIDMVILLVLVLTGFWFLVTAGMFFYLLVRFRAKEGVKAQYVTGDEKMLKKWITIPHAIIIVCDVAVIVAAVYVWYMVKQNLPDADSTIRIIAQQWAWTFQHPGADNVLDTEDDIFTIDELHIEVNKTYHYRLASRDVLHDFSVPVFRLKQDAIPGREIVGWFEATATGEWDIQCAEICGIGHGIMRATLYTESPEAHAAWVATMSAK